MDDGAAPHTRRPRRVARRPRAPRRTAGVVTAGVLALAQLLGAAPAHAAAVPVTGGRAVPAPELTDSVGVAVHLAYADTPYADLDRVADALADLGIRHVRDDLFLDHLGTTVPLQITALDRLAAQGVRATLILGNPGRTGNGNPGAHPVEAYTRAIVESPTLRRATEALEGTNEWDLFSHFWGEPATWARDVVARQKALLAAVRAEPALSGLPVLSPSLAFGDSRTEELRRAAVLAGTSLGTVANAHFYTGGWKPSGTRLPLGDMVGTARSLVPSAPVTVTETGYHNALGSVDGHRPVPERVAATYLTRLPAANLLAGIDRSYVYELLDQGPNALLNPEQSFGLVRHDGTHKPAYRGLRALLRLVEDRGAPRSGRLRYRIRGRAAGTEQLLLRKSDGRYVLLLWRAVDVWDPDLQRPRRAKPDRVRLVLPRRRAVRVYEPTTGCPEPVARGAKRRIRLAVDGSVTAVVIGRRGRTDYQRPLPACRS